MPATAYWTLFAKYGIISIMSSSHETSASKPEYSTPQQADSLRKAVEYLIAEKGVYGQYYMADVSEFPAQLQSLLPEAMETQAGIAMPPKYGLAALPTATKEPQSLILPEDDEEAQATLELRRWQWVNLNNANHPDGNLKAVHLIYRVMGKAAIDKAEPNCLLQKFVIANGSSMPIITGIHVTDELPEAVPYNEADALIAYVVEKSANGSFDNFVAPEE